MPNLQEIESFKRELNSTGNEEGILAERGETIEDVPPPESGLSDDLSQLLELGSEDGETEPGYDFAEEPPAEELAEPFEEPLGEELAEPLAEPPVEVTADDDFDILGDMEIEEGESAENEPDGEVAGGTDGFDIDGIFPETPGDEESAGISEEEYAGLAGFEETAEDAADETDGLDEGLFEELPEISEEPFTGDEDVPDSVDSPEADIPDLFADEAGSQDEPAAAGLSDEDLFGPVEAEPGEPTADVAFDEGDIADDIFSEPEDQLSDEPEGAGQSGDESPVEPFDDAFGGLSDEDLFGEAPEADQEDRATESADLEGEDFAEPSSADEAAEIGDFDDEFDIPEGFDAPVDLAEEEPAETPEELEPAPIEDSEFSEISEAPAEDIPADDAGLEGEFSIPEEFSFDDEALGEAFSESTEEESFDTAASAPDETEEFFSDEAPEDSFEAPVAEDYEEPIQAESDGFDEDLGGAETPDSEEFAFEEGVDDFDLVSGAGEMPADEYDTEAPAEKDEDEEIREVGEEDFDLDDFSLGDISEHFGVSEEEAAELPTEEELNPALSVGDAAPGVEAQLDLTDPQFEAMQRTLGILPRNLRIIIEEAIGEQQLSGEELETLVDALVRGRSPKEIATLAGKITGQRIIIPSQYEKRTGLEFEEEVGTFAYVFRQTVLPVLKTASLVLAALGLITFLGYRFLYRPIRATILYNRGLEQIDIGAHLEGNALFDRARELRKARRRYYDYADAFIGERRTDLAVDKYEELLANYPLDKKGTQDYANLDTYELAEYAHAENLLQNYLDEPKNIYDYDTLLQLGDNYMEWAVEEPKNYENARRTFAVLIQQHGSRDEVMFRMLEYFIRTDNLPEVLKLKQYFQNVENLDLDPIAYAELGGYLISRDEIEGRTRYASDARDILFEAMKEDEDLPEIHYNLARLFRFVEDYGEEKKALRRAFTGLRTMRSRSTAREEMYIDTIDRQGEVAFHDTEYLLAEDKFIVAKKRYEDALQRGRLSREPIFGRIYSNLADIYYYISGNFSGAADNYRRAIEHGYSTPDLYYKMGHIDYRKELYDSALLRFYESAGDYSSNVNLMYATANTLYQQNLYSAAQGYYLHVLTSLESQLKNIPILRPGEVPEHRALVDNLTKTHNNLGATLFRLAERSTDNRKVSQALVNLTTSSEYFDRLTRDRETFVRTESKNLAYLNTRAIIYRDAGYDVEIYNDIPRDLAEGEL